MSSIKFNSERIPQENKDKHNKKWVDLQKGVNECSCGHSYETHGTVEDIDEKYWFVRCADKCPHCNSDNMSLKFEWF